MLYSSRSFCPIWWLFLASSRALCVKTPRITPHQQKNNLDDPRDLSVDGADHIDDLGRDLSRKVTFLVLFVRAIYRHRPFKTPHTPADKTYITGGHS